MDGLQELGLPVGANFALLRRQAAPSSVDLLWGRTHRYQSLSQLARERATGRFGANPLLVCIPYRQIIERGWTALDDGEAILVLEGEVLERLNASVLEEFGQSRIVTPTDIAFDISEEAYEELVRSVVSEEIAGGEGSSFVVSRSLCGRFPKFDVKDTIGAFHRLSTQEPNAYWSFAVYFDGRVLIGASPERHVTVDAGTVLMTPISGTLRHANGLPAESELVSFLRDDKELAELNMVLDEELKMLGRLCPLGGQVIGPALRSLTSVTHTEYEIRGRTKISAERVLFETMLSPAVVGSPVENAARVIARRESKGRGYYTGVIGLIEPLKRWDVLDSCIAIRTLDLRDNGVFRLSVGATIVQGSVAESEAAETVSKAMGIFNVLCGNSERTIEESAPIMTRRVADALRSRNALLSPYWFMDPWTRRTDVDKLVARVVLVDAEDSFTLMLGSMLSALGLSTSIVSTKDIALEGVGDWFESRVVGVQRSARAPTVLVLGPGPGDPSNSRDSRIRVLKELCMLALRARRPFLAVCLSHQVLGQQLGLRLRRLHSPNQGVSKPIVLDDRKYQVGFYNSYTLLTDKASLDTKHGRVRVYHEPDSGEVYALRGETFWSLQFHVESVLSRSGADMLSRVMGDLTH